MCGVAMDVPLKFAYELSLAFVHERVFVPGALDVGFDAIASIGCNWAAAAKSSNCISSRVQSANAVSRLVNSGRVYHGRTTRPRILCGRYHHDASSGLSFNGGLQRVERTTFRGRTVPGVTCNIRCFGRVGIATADPRRSKEPLHALDITSRRAKVCVHIAATDPLCARRHPDLVTLIRHHRPWCRWYASRALGHRMGTANRFRKDYQRCHGSNRASYNRDRHFGRPTRGNAA